jgi:hypothetical protein
MAFDAYDLGMTSLRTLQKQKIITEAQYQDVKNKVGWPFYNAIKAADSAANAWVAATSDSTYTRMVTALQEVANAQKDFTTLITSLQGGK